LPLGGFAGQGCDSLKRCNFPDYRFKPVLVFTFLSGLDQRADFREIELIQCRALANGLQQRYAGEGVDSAGGDLACVERFWERGAHEA
jgi:hypothetical protein